PGTLQYEVFFNADESEAIVFERYRDAESALAHFANIGHLMEPLMATATVTGEVLETPNDTMRANLDPDGQPTLYTPWMAAHESIQSGPRDFLRRRHPRERGPTLASREVV
ncbi:MAG: hypothetical protein ACK5O2_14460, partial [Microthrixaceae bacterium]